MTMRTAAIKFLGAVALLAGLGAPNLASAGEVIKIGTLAPAASPYGQVFKIWADAVKVRSNGQLELQFFFNGQQGDEGAMVGKMKSGQLDGAAVTAVGLGKIYKPILALEVPGLFTNWTTLDFARNALKPEFEKGAADAGFMIAGWGDVGLLRQFSKAFAVRVPDDLKAQKPFLWRDDVVQTLLFQTIGGVTPVPLNIPEVLPQLNTGAINFVAGTSLATEQLNWSSKLDTIQDEVRSASIGAIVVSSKRFDALPPDLKAIFVDTGKVAGNALTARIRAEDAAALARLKGKLTVVTLKPEERAKWDTLYKQIRQKLVPGTFAPDLIARLEGFASQLITPVVLTANYYCGKYYCFSRGLDLANPTAWTASPILASATSLPPPVLPPPVSPAPRAVPPTTPVPPGGMYCDSAYCYWLNDYKVWIAEYTGNASPLAPRLPG
jgi:TRAP-type C4-dicarboxylate transport system substrate-binding protein